jgi:hypothetical protein
MKLLSWRKDQTALNGAGHEQAHARSEGTTHQVTAGHQAELEGTIGLEIQERVRVDVTGVQITGGGTQVEVNDPRVVEALQGGANGTRSERAKTTYLEVPFKISDTGNVVINVETLREIAIAAKGITVGKAEQAN